MTWFINDLECENKPWYGSIASPHNPENYIVATGYCIDNGEIQYKYYDSADEANNDDWLATALEGQKVYVAHNATFEIHWLLSRHRETFLNWIKNGGVVFCTQYAEFLLSNQSNLYPKLEDCSVKYRDSSMDEHDVRKIDEVKLLWEQGALTSEIDKSLLLDYLIHPVHGDVANTRRVCFKQYEQLKKRGMWRMFMMRMDSLLFNALATFNGLHVDKDTAYKNLAEQVKRMDELRTKIEAELPKDMPEDLEFSWSSDYHQSAFLFGGQVKYRTKVSYDPIKYEKGCFHKLLSDNEEYITKQDYMALESKPCVVRYSRGKRKGEPKEFMRDTEVEKLKWGEGYYTFDGLIDLTALPVQVREQYLGKRAEFRGKRELPCGTPVYSTSGDSLAILSKFTDVAKPLNELAKLNKDTGTYYLMQKGNKTSGMLQYLEPSGIIHHNLNNCATVTARLSSTKPNFQNLPRTDEDDAGVAKSLVKTMFTSRFGAEGKIVEVDYSALEVVTLAAISGDTNLMRMLRDNIDMHCYRLAAQLGENYDEVRTKAKDDSHPDYPNYSAMRQAIKPKAFAHQYGATAAGISFSTGCTLEEAEAFKETEFKLFPESNAFPIEVVRPEIEKTGLQGTMHRDNINGEWVIYRVGTYQANSGTTYAFKQYQQWREGQQVVDYKDTQIANYWCQGEASLIVQAACGRVIRALIDNDFFDGTVLPINTVHDAIYLDCKDAEAAKIGGKFVQDIMEATPAWMVSRIPALAEWNYDTTPFPAVAEMGASMAEKQHIH